MPGNSIVTPLNLGIAYAVVVAVYVLAGRAQRREVGASVGRLWTAATLLAVLVLVPAMSIMVEASATGAAAAPAGETPMFSGPWEILIVLAIVLLLFGKRLPNAMHSLGRSIVEFKKGIKGADDQIED